MTTKLQRVANEEDVTFRSLNLWIPTHMIHDAESDDNLAWLLLKYVHNLISKRTEKVSNFQATELH